MLKLKDIVKEYPVADSSVIALKGVSVNFRSSEFVSVLGHSGCGKTTLLNIIGGLDQYTSGELFIKGKSTKAFKDTDWDTYRNHSVGFVFQTYNLIPHQTVLANVELALTLSGVSKTERRQRAKDALTRVGLGDQFSKKPNQLSGGQMQRVAIARALVNDPEILLADEPTGALDSETSVQVIDILKEISKEKLVIMVTHNPELAEKYSSRIIRLVDGKIVEDSDPYDGENSEATEKTDKKAKKKPSMSFFTALSLSFTNLLTKKMRTFLTSFAGSIGIIGIALILSLSSGFQAYIDSIQQEALTSYPLLIDVATMDMNSMMTSMTGIATGEIDHDRDKVYSNTLSQSMVSSFSSEIWFNDLSKFKEFLESDKSNIKDYVSSIQYTYSGDMNIYCVDETVGTNQVYPSPALEMANSMMGTMGLTSMGINTTTMEAYTKNINSWLELVNNQELLSSQYELIKGEWPSAYNEVVLVIDKNNEISDLAIQGLGLLSTEEMTETFLALMKGEEIEQKKYEIEYDEIIGRKFKLVTEPEYFEYNEETKTWDDKHGDEEFIANLIDKAEDITVVGIIRPDEESLMVTTVGNIGYTAALTEYVVNKTNEAEIVKQQKANSEIDVFTGIPFPVEEEEEKTEEKPKEPKKEGETEKAKTQDVMSANFEKPTVSSLGFNGTAPKTTFTQTPPMDFSKMPEASKEDVYAAIDENYSGAEAEKMKRTVDLMLKPVLSISERRELAANLDEMLQGVTVEGIGTISGDQAVTFLSMMTTSDKLKMLYAIINGKLEGVTTPEGTELPTEPSTPKDPGQTTPQQPVIEPEPELEPEPEPQPLASNYEEALSLLGVGDLAHPKQISIYPLNFESKDAISNIIREYNASVTLDKEIKYTDYIGLLLTSVSKIINIISYILIAFVAISLVVSSIMIGIITYISVLERTKEIGILRAIGASKRDISRVFNAETLVVGFVSGMIGIGATLLLTIPINLVIKHFTTIPNVAQLPTKGGLILVITSMVLSLISGLIPSRIASKKDPVEALRTE